MKKTELKRLLKENLSLDRIMPLCAGQECEIYKGTFDLANQDDICYIPDISLNELNAYSATLEDFEVDEIIANCYTTKDFVEECNGDVALARRLFYAVDWQHPSSALPELGEEEEMEDADDSAFVSCEEAPVTLHEYEEVARFKNVTISIVQCVRCKKVEILWTKQDDTEQMPLDDNSYLFELPEQEGEDSVGEALRILDAIHSSGRLDYGDYCELHDAISTI